MAIAFVQANAGSATNVQINVTTTLSSQPTLGNLLVGGFVTRGSSNDQTTWPSGWVKLGLAGGMACNVFNGGYCVLAARIVTDPSTQQATTVSGAVDYKRLGIGEFSGVLLSSIVQDTNPLVSAEENTANGSSRTTPSVATPGHPCLIIGIAVSNVGHGLASSDLTQIDAGPATSGLGAGYYIGYRIEGSPTTETASFTNGDSGSNWGDALAVFSNPVGRTTFVMV